MYCSYTVICCLERERVNVNMTTWRTDASTSSRSTTPRSLKAPRLLTTTTMAKTALITGATGLLGRQVVKAFERHDWAVVGTGFARANPPATRKLDLGSEADITKTFEEVQ